MITKDLEQSCGENPDLILKLEKLEISWDRRYRQDGALKDKSFVTCLCIFRLDPIYRLEFGYAVAYAGLQRAPANTELSGNTSLFSSSFPTT